MNIGRALKLLRLKKNQHIVCSDLGISQKHLSELETGVKKPRWQMLMKILNYYGAEIVITIGKQKIKVK